MRWYGKIGYQVDLQTAPGIWDNQIIEKVYYGNTKKLSSSWNNIPINDGSTYNTTPQLSLQISIVADPFAYENFSKIKYIEYMGQYWSIKSIVPEEHRLLLTIGEIYTGSIGGSNDDQNGTSN